MAIADQKRSMTSMRTIGWVGGILAATLLCVLGVAWGINAAGREAERYESAFSQWQQQTRPELLRLTSTVPAGTYVLKDQTTPTSIAAQKKSCDVVEQAAQKLAAAQKDVPVLGNAILGGLSSTYSEAKKTAATRTTTITTYLKQAVSSFEQITRDCRWNIKMNTALTPYNERLKEHARLAWQYNTTIGDLTCFTKEGCTPSDAAQRAKYFKVRQNADHIFEEKALPLFTVEQCKDTSYAAGCQEAYTMLKRISDDNVKIADLRVAGKEDEANKVFPKLAQDFKVYDPGLIALFKKQYPDFAVTDGLKESSGGVTDAWLDAAAQGYVKRLVALQVDLKKL